MDVAFRYAVEIAFWGAAGAYAYSYVLYPLALAALSIFAVRPPRFGAREPSVTMLIPARNEAQTIARKLSQGRLPVACVRQPDPVVKG